MSASRRPLLGLLLSLAVLLLLGRWASHMASELLWASSLATTRLGAVPLLPFASQLAWSVVTVAWFFLHLMFAGHRMALTQQEDRLPLAALVERSALSQRILVAIVLALPFGLLLTSGADRWWTMLALAAEGIATGVTDEVFSRDVGYYLTALPLRLHLQELFLAVALTTFVLLVFAYGAAGILRIRNRRLLLDPHARWHLATTLAAIAFLLAWSWTSSGEAGLAGLGTGFPESARGGASLPLIALLVGAATLVWAGWPREAIAGGAWATLLTAWLLFRVASSFQTHEAQPSPTSPTLYELAFGDSVTIPRPLELGGGNPDSVDALSTRLAGIAVWDSERIIDRYNANRTTGARHALFELSYRPLQPDTLAKAIWWGLLEGDPSRFQPERSTNAALEAHSLSVLGFDPLTGQVTTEDPTGRFLFSPRAQDHVIAGSNTVTGVSLNRFTSRLALAWALQQPALFQASGTLVWRRSPVERLETAVPIATFRDPFLVRVAGRWTWILDGYVTADGFPEVEPRLLDPGGPPRRYVRAGLVGQVDAATGDVTVYLAPTRDPLSDAWARILDPIIQPAEAIPPELRAALRYPPTLFRIQLRPVVLRLSQGEEYRTHRSPTWTVGTLGADDQERLWVSTAVSAGIPDSYRGILAGTVVDGTHQLVYQRLRGTAPITPTVRPGVDSLIGPLRVWPIAGALYRQQTVYEATDGNPSLAEVRAAWGEWSASGPGREEALAALFFLGPRSRSVPDIWARWLRAQDIIRQADSLLTLRDLSSFFEIFDELRDLLAPDQAPR